MKLISFKELKKFGKYTDLYRTEKMEKAYIDYKKKNSKYSKYLYKKLFKDGPINFLENKFPYNLKRGIFHYVLWSEKKLSDFEIQNILNSLNLKNYIYFENLKKNKSIKDIFHVQVFFKN